MKCKECFHKHWNWQYIWWELCKPSRYIRIFFNTYAESVSRIDTRWKYSWRSFRIKILQKCYEEFLYKTDIAWSNLFNDKNVGVIYLFIQKIKFSIIYFAFCIIFQINLFIVFFLNLYDRYYIYSNIIFVHICVYLHLKILRNNNLKM